MDRRELLIGGLAAMVASCLPRGPLKIMEDVELEESRVIFPLGAYQYSTHPSLREYYGERWKDFLKETLTTGLKRGAAEEDLDVTLDHMRRRVLSISYIPKLWK